MCTPARPRCVALFTILFLLPACSGSGGSSGTGSGVAPGTATVGPSGPAFATIQAAVDAADSGATIRIGEGTFRELLIVDKSVTIVGAGSSTRIDSGSSGFATLEIRNASDVLLEGVTVSGSGDGIVVRDSKRVVLENVTSSGNVSNGLDIRSSADVSVIGGTFDGNGDRGLRVREDSSNVTVDRCLVRNNRSGGARVLDSSGVVLRDSTFSENTEDGIEIRDAALVEVFGNDVVGNREYGIRVRNTPDLDAGTLDAANEVTGNGQGQIRIE